ncbi:MAG: hypothetical protein QOJ80_6115 [Mycobacterium sp.]|nr:hypothetical protein [Mycobacterium sp.]
MTTLKRSKLAEPVLSDGTRLRDLIDHDKHEVALRMLSDPEIYTLELDRLFARTWIPVGHESEIPSTGDFVLRRIGEDPVIVVRQPSGGVEVLLNVCPHRGMQVCRSESGNAPRFRCPYHAWAFGRDGHFLGAPFEKDMYGDALKDNDSVNLEQARVEMLGGVIFANWDPEAPELAEFFGDFKWYLDLILCRTRGGYEVLGPPQRSIVRSNWKGPAEQGSVDGYHGLGLHRSFSDVGLMQRGTTAAEAGLLSVDISANGGGIRCMPTQPRFLEALEDGRPYSITVDEAEQLLLAQPPVGMTPEMVPELRECLTDDQVRVLAGYYPSAGQAFPTFELLHINGPVLQDPARSNLKDRDGANIWAGDLAPTLVLHTWGPRTVDSFEIWTWVLAERDAPPAMKEAARKVAVQTFGSSGTIEMDDGEAWPSQTASARGAKGRKVTFKYHAFREHTPPPEWPGPGQVHTGATGDDGQWQWWQRYFRFMLGEE